MRFAAKLSHLLELLQWLPSIMIALAAFALEVLAL